MNLDAKDVRILIVEADHLILNPSSTIHCVALGRLVILSVSHFLIFKGINDSTYIIGLFVRIKGVHRVLGTLSGMSIINFILI